MTVGISAPGVALLGWAAHRRRIALNRVARARRGARSLGCCRWAAPVPGARMPARVAGGAARGRVVTAAAAEAGVSAIDWDSPRQVRLAERAAARQRPDRLSDSSSHARRGK